MSRFALILSGILMLCGLGAISLPLPAANAQPAADRAFPARPLRIVVPFTTGSTSDAASRFFAEQLAGELGQSVYVENRAGANGIIAIQTLRAAPADGHTILLGAISLMSINPIAVKDLPYDPVKDLAPISGLARGMNVIVVAADSEIRTLADFVALAKAANPALTSGSFAPGYTLSTAWLGQLAGFRFTAVPYKGQAAVLTDLIGRQLDFALVDIGGALPLVKTGKLRALAVTGEARHPEIPDVPSARESGYPDFVRYSWGGFYVRSDTPARLIERLADAMQNVLAKPESAQFAARQAQELLPLRPAAMRQYQLDELARMRAVANSIGYAPQ
ncbi:MAG: Bug family tripartite tricarboxylate transporter substrate binding protein [Burkholderiaceae bacterium]